MNVVAMADLDPREVEPRLEAKDELHRAALNGKERYTSIGTAMAVVDTEFIHLTLKKNADLFAWMTTDVPGPPGYYHPPPLRIQRSTSGGSEEKEPWAGQEAGGQDRGRKTPKGRLHRRTTILHLAGQCGYGQEGKRQMANVRGLQRSE